MKIRSWSPRVLSIIQALEADGRPHWNRGQVQTAFGIGRSQATDLMKVVGAEVRNGAETTVSREQLLYYVQWSPEAKGYLEELERKANLARQLQEVTESRRQRAIKLPGHVMPLDLPTRWEDLTNVAVEPGMLHIAFSDQNDLVKTLMLICGAMANEPGKLEEMCNRELACATTPKVLSGGRHVER